MRVLHFYPETDDMITRYVNMLCGAMESYAEISTASNVMTLRKLIGKQRPDIVHLHGCWMAQTALTARIARGKGIRTVITPHGQLEQWIIKQQYWKEKLPKTILYQRHTISRAYSVIAMGPMEANGLMQLRWNPRVETVYNPLITDSISTEEAGRKVFDIYQKVLDSNVIELMNADTRNAIEPLIKAGLTGDNRWLNDREYNAITTADDIDWRALLIYAQQENIIDTIYQGISVLNITPPNINPAAVPCYYPERFANPKSLAEAIGKKKNDANKRIVAMVKQVKKLVTHRTLAIRHIVELAAELRNNNIEDDKVSEMLDVEGLGKFAACLMHVLADVAGLDEGFMPIAEKSGHKANNIKKVITKHLEI